MDSSSYIARMRARAAILKGLRAYFDGQDFLEVDTPVAIRAPAPELHIEAPSVELQTLRGTQRRYLQTSPELPMKRLLGTGLGNIYQIAPCFRQQDDSPQHTPEFRLLEWYRMGAPWSVLMDDCESIVHIAYRAAAPHMSTSQEPNFPLPRITVDDAFMEHAGFSVLKTPSRESLWEHAQRLGTRPTEDDSWDDLYHRIFIALVEPKLVHQLGSFFLTEYPIQLAALAQANPKDERVAERVELYLHGLELANGFGELTDAAQQRERFARGRKARVAKGLSDYPLDEDFLRALETLSDCAGMALGLERLVMAVLGCGQINDVNYLPWSHT